MAAIRTTVGEIVRQSLFLSLRQRNKAHKPILAPTSRSWRSCCLLQACNFLRLEQALGLFA